MAFKPLVTGLNGESVDRTILFRLILSTIRAKHGIREVVGQGQEILSARNRISCR